MNDSTFLEADPAYFKQTSCQIGTKDFTVYFIVSLHVDFTFLNVDVLKQTNIDQ